MRWLILVCMFWVGSLQAFNDADFYVEDDEMIALDNEIEELLDEEDTLDSEMAMEDFDDLELEAPAKKESSVVVPIKTDISSMQIQEIEEKSLPVEVDRIVAQDETLVLNPLEAMKEETAKSIAAIEINLKEVFAGSPIIYSILFFLSTISVCVWLYSMLTIRSFEFLPPKLIKDLRTKLLSNQFDEALDLCHHQKHFFCKMLASGILARKHGLNIMVDTMKAEGKRSTVAFWQRINVLNEIAVIAPMLGLLGTVLGMFYAFYDLNRSIESVSLLFDGLGISVGTTVAGLIVAILAMILHSVVKYRLVRILANVENEAQIFAALIDTRSPNYLEK